MNKTEIMGEGMLYKDAGGRGRAGLGGGEAVEGEGGTGVSAGGILAGGELGRGEVASREPGIGRGDSHPLWLRGLLGCRISDPGGWVWLSTSGR